MTVVVVQQIEAFRETRCIVIDEISFAGYAGFLKKLSDKLQRYSEDSEVPYGSFDIFFTGDFLQLQPCNREDTIYYNEGSLLWEQSLTTLVELDGQHRFSECPDYQAIMPALRSGNITNEIRNKLNTRVVDGINVKLPTADGTRLQVRELP